MNYAMSKRKKRSSYAVEGQFDEREVELLQGVFEEGGGRGGNSFH